ncbi:MAG: hypothetical protein OYM47_20035 [Gemmatimonadota bacterium]|nr:hypothetical protein [Gemmatimonadota bacterium]
MNKTDEKIQRIADGEAAEDAIDEAEAISARAQFIMAERAAGRIYRLWDEENRQLIEELFGPSG